MKSSTQQKKRAASAPIGYTVAGVVAMAGGCAAVAKSLGITVQTVAQWDYRIPDQLARQLAIMAGLPLAVVRPDHVQER